MNHADTKKDFLKPAVADVKKFPKEYDWDGEAAFAKTDMLNGEFKIDKNSEFGKVPNSKDISRKYEPGAVAWKNDE